MTLKSYLLFITFTFIFLTSWSSYGQFTLTGTFSEGFRIDEVTLEQYGLNPQIVASKTVTHNAFRMSIPQNLTLGIYKLNYKAGQSKSSFDLIITNKEDIDFSLTLSPSEFTPPQFSKSDINSTWLSEQKMAMDYNLKIQVIQQAWASYPDRQDKLIKTLEKKLTKLVDLKSSQVNRLQKTYPFISFVLQNIQPKQIIDPAFPIDKQDSLFISEYWKSISTNDVTLLNTPILNDLVYRYIDYYLQKNKNLTKQTQDQEMEHAIDRMLGYFTQEETRAFAINYLTFGFKQMGNEAVLQYIDETYSDIDQCDNPNALNERLEGYQKLKAGNLAPAILESGENILQHLTNQKTLLVFWASWCPHCMKEIPMLYNSLKDKDIRIVAVSLDTDEHAYLPIKEKLSGIIHYCDFKKWDSQPVNDYYIKGTPTYFLLDKDNTILNKYTSLKAVQSSL